MYTYDGSLKHLYHNEVIKELTDELKEKVITWEACFVYFMTFKLKYFFLGMLWNMKYYMYILNIFENIIDIFQVYFHNEL